MTPRYMPVLKGRQGELAALGMVEESTWTELQPLIEVMPPTTGEAEEVDADTVIASAAEKLRVSLARNAVGRRLAIDPVHLLGLSADDRATDRTLQTVCSATEEAGIAVVPVIRLSDRATWRSAIASLNRDHGRGCCVRLLADDVTEDPEDIDDALSELCREVGLSRHDVDLVLDLGAVTDEPVSIRSSGLAARLLLRGLSVVDDWRSITVVSGAFPVDLSRFRPWQEGLHPRSDADVWAEVQQRRIPRVPDFGDYAIAHPSLTIGVPFAPPPQLRYTTAGHWLILKGDKRDPRGNGQFYDICEAVSRSAEFAGAALGAADTRIAHPRGDGHGPGNATTWRTLGTAHHLDFVVRRLTTLGEP